jgi:hypothetical protein
MGEGEGWSCLSLWNEEKRGKTHEVNGGLVKVLKVKGSLARVYILEVKDAMDRVHEVKRVMLESTE